MGSFWGATVATAGSRPCWPAQWPVDGARESARIVPASGSAGASSSRELQGQGDALSLEVDVEHFYLDDVPGLDDVMRVLDVVARELGDMDEAVLMDADVDESAEGGDVEIGRASCRERV